jgi:hypothetical protein
VTDLSRFVVNVSETHLKYLTPNSETQLIERDWAK